MLLSSLSVSLSMPFVGSLLRVLWPVNPSLLSMFERSLRPSLQLGISLHFTFFMAPVWVVVLCPPPSVLPF